VTILTVGTCTLQATQAGNASFLRTPVNQSFTVSQASQTITFNSLGSVSFGVAAVAVSATSTSNLQVAFSSAHNLRLHHQRDATALP